MNPLVILIIALCILTFMFYMGMRRGIGIEKERQLPKINGGCHE